ncbi:hypothetical protein DLM20_24915, partial [Salmonella enterica subsp. enterica serovar Java]|nr:hypothetical protein [Salmonella enterica subsp. enterica serovar Java]
MNIAVRDSAGVPVTLAPFPLDPDKGRQTTHVLPGTTLADAIGYNFPALPEEAMPRVQAHVVDPGKDEATIIPRWEWAHYRLAQGAAVVIRIGPAGPFAMLAVQGAAMLASSLGGTAMAGVLGLSAAAWGSIIGLGVTLIGGLLVNLLFPTKKPKEDRPSYLIEGFRNEARPDQPIPMPLGRVRSAPPLGATSYVEIVNGVLYTRALLINGIGQYRIFNERFGSTPISRYK